MHEPINPHSTFNGHPFAIASAFILETGVPLSGVKGPLICGSKSERFNSIIDTANYTSAVRYVDGHDIDKLKEAFDSLPFEKGKPSVIIANTITDKGNSLMENNIKWHHGVPGNNEYEIAIAEPNEIDLHKRNTAKYTALIISTH